MSSNLSLKVTFYGYPDNDDGEGHFGTNVIHCYTPICIRS